MAWFVKADSRNRGDEDETYLSPQIEIIPEDQQRYETMGTAYAQKLIDDYRAAGKEPYDYALIASDPYPSILLTPYARAVDARLALADARSALS